MTDSKATVTVLIVDDEPDIRYLIRVVLEEAGYRVCEASNGAEALDSIGNESPGIVVTDLMMPVMSGQELIKRLRTDPTFSSIPIVVVSAMASSCEKGADTCCAKPFQPKDLVNVVRRLALPGRASA